MNCWTFLSIGKSVWISHCLGCTITRMRCEWRWKRYDRAMNRFDYLTPSIGPVVEGLENNEKIYALEQMDKYNPLRTLPGENGKSAIYRLELTDDQRKIIAEGGDVLVEILHLGGPLLPSRVMVLNQKDLSDDERNSLKHWFAAQTAGPYRG